MKLLPTVVALAGTTTAFNVNEFLAEAATKIYTQTDNGYKISLEPYMTLNCKDKSKGDIHNQQCTGTAGNGEETNSFIRNTYVNPKTGVFKYQGKDWGSSSNWWLNQYWLDEKHLDTKFKVVEQVVANWGDISKANIKWTRKGNFGKYKGATSCAVALKEAGLKRGKYSVKAVISGAIVMPDGFPEDLNWLNMSPAKWNILVSTKAKQACASEYFTSACMAQVSIKGKAGSGRGQSIDSKLKYSVLEDNKIFELQGQAQNKVCKLKLTYELKKISLEYIPVAPKGNTELVFTIPNVGLFDAISAEAVKLAQPFIDYGEAAVADLDTAAHAVVWIDYRWQQLDNEFDCSALVASTQFESSLIAKALGKGKTTQQFLQAGCKTINDIVVDFLQNTATPALEEARDYVNNLTDEDVGKQQYLEWYKTL